MTRDELRALAGLPTGTEALGKRTFSESKDAEDKHFGLENEGNVAKAVLILAKEGFTIDLEFAMGIYYFNFKDKATTKKAYAIVNRVIDKKKEQE